MTCLNRAQSKSTSRRFVEVAADVIVEYCTVIWIASFWGSRNCLQVVSCKEFSDAKWPKVTTYCHPCQLSASIWLLPTKKQPGKRRHYHTHTHTHGLLIPTAMDKKRHAGMLPPQPPPHLESANRKPNSSAREGGGGGEGAKWAIISPTKAAEPRFGAVFDAWNSSSSGHQRAENRLGASTGWRDSRNVKLHSQFCGDAKRVSDAVGAGASDLDPRLKAVMPPELRARARSSVADMLAKPGIMQRSISSSSFSSFSSFSSSTPLLPPILGVTIGTTNRVGHDSTTTTGAEVGKRPAQCGQRIDDESKNVSPGREEGPGRLFAGAVIYVNGSTHPQISDHKLKHILAEHGGRLSTHLGRRQVTHVILGRPAGGGGGLAGTKLQKEIQNVRGAAVKFVGVEWYVSNISSLASNDFCFVSYYPLHHFTSG